jgi:nitrile hydratase
VEEEGLSLPGLKLVVLENTPKVHHMIVCTLCSCYPRTILGLPPLWYKSRAYRTRTVREPRVVLSEFGTELPDSVEVRVVDSTADCRYLVLPMRPEGTEGMSEAELASLVSRDSLVGVAPARRPNGRSG